MLLLPVYTDLQEKKKEGLPPDFLWSLLALVNFMRLSLLKAAHAVMSGAAYRKSGTPTSSTHVPESPRTWGTRPGRKACEQGRDLSHNQVQSGENGCYRGAPATGAPI
jgi:hypothetical protein